VIPINKWAGLVTNASQYAIPPGAAVEQVNLQCLIPGQLTVRPGMTPVTLPVPSTATTSIVRAFRYQHGSAEHIVYQDAQGNIYSSVVAAGAVTTTSPPGAPVIAAALPGNTTIAVSITAPTDTGGSAITGYSFQVSTDNGTTWTGAGSSTATSYTITGLVNGTAYRIRASANNASGTGDYSASFGPVSPSAPVVRPASPPAVVTATAAAANTATVAWYTPSDNGGSPITGYSVQSSPDRGLTWSAAATTGVVSQSSVSGLLANTDYVFRVAAITSYGTGQYSTASNSVSIVGATSTPSQPQNLSGIATTTSVTLSWGAPANNGGSAVTGYAIRYGTSSQGPWTVQSASGLTGTVSGLTANTRYTFGVYASNANGGGQAASIDVTTLAAAVSTAPSSPTNLVLTRTADGFTATWDAPASTGGSAITEYRLTTAATGTGPETLAYQSLARSYTATGLTAGSLVWVAVYAVNAVGSSNAMRANVAVGIAPSAPRNFTATPTNSQVTLSWLPPATLYGQQVLSYLLTYGQGYGVQAAGNATSQTMIPISGQPFAAGASYTYTIAAVTASGTGATASVTFTVPAAPAVPPSAPQNLVLTPNESGFIASWEAPATTGTPAFIGYKTYVLVGGAWTLKDTRSATSRNYQATGYPQGTAISVRVTAYSSAAESVPAEGTVTPFSAATAPRNLSFSLAYVLADRATVSLSWTEPSSLGGLALTRYVIYKDGVESAASSTTASTITQLPGTATYTVYAQTTAGLSPVSNSVTVTAAVPTAPAAPTLTLFRSTGGELQFIAYSALPAGMSSIAYTGQFSLDLGVTWQAATPMLSGTEGGSAKFLCTIPYASTASRVVLGRAQATASAGGVSKTSGWSSSLSATVTFSAPVFAPTITSTELPGGKVRIFWTAPSSTGGSVITQYTVLYSGAGVSTTEYNAGLGLQYDLTRQTNNAATIVIRARNALGVTASAPYTLPAVLPAPGWQVVEPNGSSTGVQANSDGTVKLRAEHPAGIEWQTIAFYRWQSSPDQVTWTTLADTPTVDDAQGRAYTATSQPAGLRYYRSLVSVGGVLSAPSIAKSKPTEPGAVRSLAMTRVNSGAGWVSTASWVGSLYDGGRAITAYELQTAWIIGTDVPTTWSSTVEHSVATYGSGPYTKEVTFPTSPSPGGPSMGEANYWIRVRAAVSRDFSDPIRAGQWTYVTRTANS
jgi:hypothetical protein